MSRLSRLNQYQILIHMIPIYHRRNIQMNGKTFKWMVHLTFSMDFAMGKVIFNRNPIRRKFQVFDLMQISMKNNRKSKVIWSSFFHIFFMENRIFRFIALFIAIRRSLVIQLHFKWFVTVVIITVICFE